MEKDWIPPAVGARLQIRKLSTALSRQGVVVLRAADPVPGGVAEAGRVQRHGYSFALTTTMDYEKLFGNVYFG